MFDLAWCVSSCCIIVLKKAIANPDLKLNAEEDYVSHFEKKVVPIEREGVPLLNEITLSSLIFLQNAV